MTAKIYHREQFNTVVDYANAKKKQARMLYAEGVRLDNNQTIALSMQIQASTNSRVSKPVGHISLNFSHQDSDRLTDELMVEIAKKYLAELEIENTQVVIFRHFDREHPHIHIIFNRVDNYGRTISDSREFERSVKTCKLLTLQYGLYMASGKEAVKENRLRGKTKIKYEMMHKVQNALARSHNWNDFKKECAREGLSFSLRMKEGNYLPIGIRFSDGQHTFSGSKLDKSLGFQKLCFVLGLTPPSGETPSLIPRDLNWTSESAASDEGVMNASKPTTGHVIPFLLPDMDETSAWVEEAEESATEVAETINEIVDAGSSAALAFLDGATTVKPSGGGGGGGSSDKKKKRDDEQDYKPKTRFRR